MGVVRKVAAHTVQIHAEALLFVFVLPSEKKVDW